MQCEKGGECFVRVARLDEGAGSVTLGLPRHPDLVLDLEPGRDPLVGQVGGPGFDAATMLGPVAQPGLDLQQTRPSAKRRLSPALAGFGNEVDGVDHDIAAEQEVGERELVDDGIRLDADGPAGPLQGCLHCVDA